jgi:uncharacterized protein (TIGR00369 family)
MSDRAKPDTFGTSASELQARIQASPFNSWLGLHIETIHPEGVDFVIPWRAEFVGTPQLNRVHGGVLTALADAAGGYTVMSRTGVSLSTIDLRVDFHRAAAAGDLRLRGRLVNVGRRISCVDIQIFDSEGTLVASGRGNYYTPTS